MFGVLRRFLFKVTNIYYLSIYPYTSEYDMANDRTHDFPYQDGTYHVIYVKRQSNICEHYDDSMRQ